MNYLQLVNERQVVIVLVPEVAQCLAFSQRLLIILVKCIYYLWQTKLSRSSKKIAHYAASACTLVGSYFVGVRDSRVYKLMSVIPCHLSSTYVALYPAGYDGRRQLL